VFVFSCLGYLLRIILLPGEPFHQVCGRCQSPPACWTPRILEFPLASLPVPHYLAPRTLSFGDSLITAIPHFAPPSPVELELRCSPNRHSG